MSHSEFLCSLDMHLAPGRKDSRGQMLSALMAKPDLALELAPADIAVSLSCTPYSATLDTIVFSDANVELLYRSIGIKKKLFKKVTSMLCGAYQDTHLRKRLGFASMQATEELTEEEPVAKPVAEPGSLFDPLTEEGDHDGDEHEQ